MSPDSVHSKTTTNPLNGTKELFWAGAKLWVEDYCSSGSEQDWEGFKKAWVSGLQKGEVWDERRSLMEVHPLSWLLRQPKKISRPRRERSESERSMPAGVNAAEEQHQEKRKKEAVDWLLENGVNPDEWVKWGDRQLPLVWVCALGGHVEALQKILFHLGGDPNSVDSDGNSLLEVLHKKPKAYQLAEVWQENNERYNFGVSLDLCLPLGKRNLADPVDLLKPWGFQTLSVLEKVKELVFEAGGDRNADGIKLGEEAAGILKNKDQFGIWRDCSSIRGKELGALTRMWVENASSHPPNSAPFQKWSKQPQTLREWRMAGQWVFRETLASLQKTKPEKDRKIRLGEVVNRNSLLLAEIDRKERARSALIWALSAGANPNGVVGGETALTIVLKADMGKAALDLMLAGADSSKKEHFYQRTGGAEMASCQYRVSKELAQYKQREPKTGSYWEELLMKYYILNSHKMREVLALNQALMEPTLKQKEIAPKFVIRAAAFGFSAGITRLLDAGVLMRDEDWSDALRACKKMKPYSSQLGPSMSILRSRSGLSLQTVARDVAPEKEEPLSREQEAVLLVELANDGGTGPRSSPPFKPPTPNANTEKELFTQLCQAAKNGTPEEVQHWLVQGADCLTGDEKGKTPLHYAVQAGNVEAVEKLLSAGADPWVEDREGICPVAQAGLTGEKGIESIKLLLKARKDWHGGGLTPQRNPVLHPFKKRSAV